MRPSYQTLVKLNPLISKRSYEEVDDVIDELESLGFSWNESDSHFENLKTDERIGTRGLDMFVKETIRDFILQRRQEYSEFPVSEEMFYFYKNIWASWLPKLLLLTVTWGFLAWAFVDWKIWIIGCLILIGSLGALHFYCFNGFAKSQKYKLDVEMK